VTVPVRTVSASKRVSPRKPPGVNSSSRIASASLPRVQGTGQATGADGPPRRGTTWMLQPLACPPYPAQRTRGVYGTSPDRVVV
jgi:hypothetical protein